MTVQCPLCAVVKKNIEKAGGRALKWTCNHRPRIVLSRPFKIETCTVVWEKMA